MPLELGDSTTPALALVDESREISELTLWPTLLEHAKPLAKSNGLAQRVTQAARKDPEAPEESLVREARSAALVVNAVRLRGDAVLSVAEPVAADLGGIETDM